MKMRSARGNAVELKVITLICGLLLLANYGGWVNRARPGKAVATGIATDETTRAAYEKQKPNPRWVGTYNKLPLRFEENQGQTAGEVRYLSHGSGYELFLTAQEAVLALSNPVRLDLSPRHRFATLLALRKARRASQAQQLTAVRLHFEGANPEPQIVGTGEMPGKVNYFIGNDPEKWHTGVPTFMRVNYTGVYPGIDLVFYGQQRHLEYDFVVAPGADPKAIRLSVEGARKLRVNANGDLVLNVGGRKIEFQKPVVYQQVNGKRYEIAGRYAVVGDHRVTFVVGEYDRSEPLILDPVLNFSSYLGGSSDDVGSAIAVDSNNNVVVAGTTMSTDFPTTANAFKAQPVPANVSPAFAAFVTEMNPTGTQLKYSTYLAGSTPAEAAFGVDVDATGKIYVTGFTVSTDFPTSSTSANFKPGFKVGTNSGNVNGTSFIVKLDPAAATGQDSFLYSSYIGGTNGTSTNGGDFGQGIAADQKQNGVVYVTGYTDSSRGASVTDFAGFPVVGGFQTALSSANGNAFLSKIDTTQSGTASLLYSSYLGGNTANFSANSQPDMGDGVATDSAGSAYIGGITSSTNLATTANATQPTYPTGNTTNTGFVARIDTTPAQAGPPSLIYLSYLGGAGSDFIDAIALGGTVANIAYVTGQTQSPNFPTTTGAFSTTKGASGAAFVTLVDTKAAVSAPPALPTYSTFVGGTGGDEALGIKVDSQGNAYVGGKTASTNFPLAAGVGPFQPAKASGAFGNGFVFKLSPLGNGSKDLLYSTYFGGSGDGNSSDIDQVEAIAIDASNNAYITGHTFSTAASFPVFPTTAFQTTRNGPSDAFVAKLTLIPTMVVAPATLNFGAVQIGTANPPTQTVTLTNNTNATITFTSAAVSGGNPSAANADYTVSANTCTGGIPAGAIPTNKCIITVKFNPTIVGTETATLVLTDGDSTSPQNISLTGSGSPAPPPDFTLSAAPTTLTVAQGAVGAPVTISVNPTNGFASAVALTCTGAPAKSSCVLSPTSITPPTTSTLTFTAHATFVPLPISKPAPPLNFLRIVPLFLALMLIFLLRSTQRLRARLLTVSAIVICVTLAACSGGNNSNNDTVKGTYPLTVTGTSGALSHTTTVTVTVN